MTMPIDQDSAPTFIDPFSISGHHAISLVDTAAEAVFDELAHLAAEICEVPIGLITLLDQTTQRMKSCIGMQSCEVNRADSFCNHTVEHDDIFIVADTLEDPLFRDNLFVRQSPFIRFYAGYPLTAQDGSRFGALCVLDTVPHHLTQIQQRALQVLARQVVARMELKVQSQALDAASLEGRRIARELVASNTRFRSFMDATPAAAFMKDEAGRMLYCNRALTSRYNLEPEDWIGKDDFEIWPPEFAERYRTADIEVLAGNQTVHFVDESPNVEGHPLVWDVYKFPFADASGRRFLAGIAIDVTRERQAEGELRRSQQALRELNLKLQKLSLTDGLTQIKNRRGLEDCLERAFARSRTTGAPLSLLMLDVDHFKLFNESFGHVPGDQVLQRIAVLMKQYTRQSDILARYGGEEFIALLPETTEQEACKIAERLCDQIAADHWKYRPITVSIGVGSLQSHILTPSAFVNSVDEALYVAKHNGRKQVCLAAGTSTTATLDAVRPETAIFCPS